MGLFDNKKDKDQYDARLSQILGRSPVAAPRPEPEPQPAAVLEPPAALLTGVAPEPPPAAGIEAEPPLHAEPAAVAIAELPAPGPVYQPAPEPLPVAFVAPAADPFGIAAPAIMAPPTPPPPAWQPELAAVSFLPAPAPVPPPPLPAAFQAPQPLAPPAAPAPLLPPQAVAPLPLPPLAVAPAPIPPMAPPIQYVPPIAPPLMPAPAPPVAVPLSVSMPAVSEIAPPPPSSAILFFPSSPDSLEETGLTAPFVQDHILRTLYFAQQLTGGQITEEVGLPFLTVISGQLEALRKDQFIEVLKQKGIGDQGYLYGLTSKGSIRALEALEKTQYRGPLPVPLDKYIAGVKAQTIKHVVVTEESIQQAFSDLVIHPEILDQVGPAVNSASAMFLFGYPGNGKTSIAERITNLMGDSIYIPFAVEVDGYVVKLLDYLVHEPMGRAAQGQDARWVRIKRPTVVAGGELTMATLDLLWSEIGKFYEAPLQMKANGGMFLIDDFGRQAMRPQDLLNRWIVPLEKKVDYLTLVTGKKIQIPFDQLIAFSTNLDPKDLVDDAFLRRIKFKIDVKDPSKEHFTQIMQIMCRVRNVPFNEAGLEYMLDTWWQPFDRPLRMCQPRDILDQMIAIAKYKQVVPDLGSADLIDRACATYFVSASASAPRVAK
ncbi:MAG: hypothetical protein HYX52_02675 [Chloroflexi bacterium]|nr:hypothetical protein [Chloroflexota bacterium]